jgi:outer membrane receptor protein involved in Fe transport
MPCLTHAPWKLTLYVTNLFDKQEILAPPSQPNELNLTNDFLVNPPREIGLRVSYSFSGQPARL